jgi:hypothetical protein
VSASARWPAEITPDMLPRWAHISDAELEKDLADTQREIDDHRRLQAAEEEIARVHPSPAERRLAEFKADARPREIAQREEFVAFLTNIRSARQALALAGGQ